MKILLFGSGGQLGWELQRTSPSHIQLESYDYPDVDFSDAKGLEYCIEKSDAQWIINAAAYTAVDKAEEEEKQADQLNHLAVVNIAETARNTHKKVVQISTDFIFDGISSTPIAPDSPANPLSVYGKTKLEGENAVKQILQQDCVVIRTAWLYSSHGNNFVKTMLKLMRDRDRLSVVDDQIGTPTWANGLALCVWRAIDQKLSGVHHWTDAGVASWYDFAVAIQEIGLELKLLDKQIPISPIPCSQYPTPAKRPAFSVLDKSSIWQSLEMKPIHWRVQLKTMLMELI
nr:dTDP-4-dehydrorhamnose reductase [uncultured Desulfobacter sp.]